MKNWSLKQRILASFLVILVIMLAMAGMALSRLLNISQEAQKLRTDSMSGVYYSAAMRATWSDSFQLLADFTSAAAPADRERLSGQIHDNQVELASDFSRYMPTVATPAEQQLSDSFSASRTAYEHGVAALMAEVTKGNQSAAVGIQNTQIKPLWEQGRAQLTRIVEWNHGAADQSLDEIAESIRGSELSMIISLLIAVVVAAICGILLMRAITQPMRQLVSTLGLLGDGDLTGRLTLNRNDEFAVVEGGFNKMADELAALVSTAQRTAIQVATSVTEIAATSKQQQATASETAATTTEIGATSREISATSRDLVRTMTEVAAAAEQSSVLAGNGQDGLTHMEETMRNVMDAAGSVNAKLGILNEKASNITQVVTTINRVADQTNLLSLNAAIEAEKAGEYGRGFVVVATEIRRLADQTAVATYDIEQTVREIQSAVAAGVMGMDKFAEEVRRGIGDVQQVGDQLSQIIAQVQSLTPRVLMVNEGMQAQATGAEQINQALVQLSDATQQTVESLRQSSLAIDELNLVATGLRSGVSRFKV